MSLPTPRAAQLIIAGAFIRHARAAHALPFGDCNNPACARAYRLLMRLWPDTSDWFAFRQSKWAECARMEIADIVSDALPLTCWAEWATWAMGMHVIQENEAEKDCGSNSAFQKWGSCYCSKNITPECMAEIMADKLEESAK